MIEGDITRMLKCIKKLKKRMAYIRKTSATWNIENRGFANGIDFSVQEMEEVLAIDSSIFPNGSRSTEEP